MGKLLTQEEWEIRANKVHNFKFDYKLVRYVNGRSAVSIVCPVHGVFSQRAGQHSFGKGCYECRNYDTLSWVAEALKIHGNKYTYSKVKYLGPHSKVIITCPKHGDFEQLPKHHLNSGSGCRKCNNLNIDTWLFEANVIHNYKYTYENITSLNSYNNVEIICPIHGKFSMRPLNHTYCGQGCRECSSFGYRKQRAGTFYIYEFDNFLGFGISNVFDDSRHRAHSCTFRKFGVDACLVYRYDSYNGAKILSMESTIKKHFKVTDSGIKGFRREAIKGVDLYTVLEFIDDHLMNYRSF